MNIIDERNKRNEHRRRMKEQYDSVMKLSVADNDWERLLSEGMITFGDGTPYFYIMRGTLARFYDALDPMYEGSVNIGHTDLATFPERIIGKWTKADLRLVDIGDGRQALETRLNINPNHPLVQALEESEFDLGLSVEMSMNINEDLTNNADLNPFNVPIVDGVSIYDYAIVGNAGDVESMGIKLKGEIPKMDITKLKDLLDTEGTTTLADITKLLDEAEKAPEAPEMELEEVEEEESVEEAEESVEEAVEEVEEAVESSIDLEEILTQIASMRDELEEIKGQLAEKNRIIEETKAKLAAKEADEKAFVEKFKNLSISLTREVKREEEHKSQYTDGIGE